MKAILIRRMAIAFCLLSCICIYSCKKDASSNNGNSTDNVSLTGDDQQQVSSESDLISDDANIALNGESDFSGDNSSSVALPGNTEVNGVSGGTQVNGLINVHQLICDATITYDTADGQRRVTIVYDGTNCWGNRTRNGTVTISMPKGQRWKDVGATATITIDALTITRKRDNKSIVLNGTKTIINTSGGLLKDLASAQTITHNITGSLQVDFANGTNRTWNVSKEHKFVYDNGITIATTGTHSDGTNNNIAEWGTNRFGESFKTLITAPIIIRQDCDFRLVSGQSTVITDKGSTVITLGLDANGEPTGCPGANGSYYFKLVWTGANGKSFTIIWPY